MLALLCEGMPNKLIGRRLDISEGTVKIHVGKILGELVSSRPRRSSPRIAEGSCSPRWRLEEHACATAGLPAVNVAPYSLRCRPPSRRSHRRIRT